MFIQHTGGDYVNILASSGHDIKGSYSTSVSVMIARIQGGISGAGGRPARSAHVREHASHSESDCLDNERTMASGLLIKFCLLHCLI